MSSMDMHNVTGQTCSPVLDLMRQAAERFVETLSAQPESNILPNPELPQFGADLTWQNTLFQARSFRRAHVEWLEIENHFAVVHIVISPYFHTSAPIFGFDMISGKSQATGIFLDYSPSTPAPPPLALSEVLTPASRAQFTQIRARPEWGTIFSDDFFAIRPFDQTEIQSALALAGQAMSCYLGYLSACTKAPCGNATVSIQGQQQYALAQRMNPHTWRMLARYIGGEAARAFIDNVLFPIPDMAA